MTYNIVLVNQDYWIPEIKLDDINRHIVGGLLDPLGQIADWIVSSVKGFLDWLWELFKPILDSIFSVASKIWEAIKNVVSDVASAIWDILKGAWDAIIKGIKAVADTIYGTVKSIYETVSGIVSAITSFVSSKISDAIEFILGGIETIGKAIAGVFIDFLKTIITTISSIVLYITEDIIIPILSSLKWIFDRISNHFTQMINDFTKLLPTDCGENPDKVWAILMPALGVIGVAAIGVGSLLSVCQTSAMGCGLNLQPIATMIRDLINPALFTGLAIGAIVGASMKTPLTYWANKTFRPTIPSETKAIDLWRRNLISQLDLERYLSYHGYPDKMISKLIQSSYQIPSARDSFIMWRKGLITEAEFDTSMHILGYSYETIHNLKQHYYYDESLSELIRASDVVELDPTYLREKLTDIGMDEDSINFWMNVIALRPLRDEASAVSSALKSLFVDGYLTGDQYKSVLQQLKYSPESINLRLQSAYLMYDRNLKKMKTTVYIYQFRKGLLTAQQFLEKLVNLGVDKAVAVNIVNIELARIGEPEIEG